LIRHKRGGVPRPNNDFRINFREPPCCSIDWVRCWHVLLS
jgi:hypothetical protein